MANVKTNKQKKKKFQDLKDQEINSVQYVMIA